MNTMQRSLALALMAFLPVSLAGHCYGFTSCYKCLTASTGSACEFAAGKCQMEADADDGTALQRCQASKCSDAPSSAQKAATKLPGKPFFVDKSVLLSHNPVQRNYGISVSDVDRDGRFDAFVAGNGVNNLVLKWDQKAGKFVDVATPKLQNPAGNAIGVAACDVDGDGWEEMYVLNAQSYSGMTATTADLLFDTVRGEGKRNDNAMCAAGADEGTKKGVEASSGWYDLFAQPKHAKAASFVAGRSCACVDRTGNGRYAVLVSNYAQSNDKKQAVKLIEVGPDGALRDVAEEAGIAKSAGGRAVIAAPILAGSKGVDIFCNNEIDFTPKGGRDLSHAVDDHDHDEKDEEDEEDEEAPVADEFDALQRRTSAAAAVATSGGSKSAEGGLRGANRRRLSHRSNYFFRNNRDGTFKDVAMDLGDLRDPDNTGRGTALLDSNGDGLFDIVYGNWEGKHRLLLQSVVGSASTFKDHATAQMAVPGPVRTVIVADWDNDGYEEIFFNFIPGDNRLFRKKTPSDAAEWEQVDIGDALLPCGHGTGAAVADWDGDGRLELMVTHGESAAQPISFFHPAAGADNNWLRVLPRTQFGAPARGAVVTLVETGGRRQLRAIDGGSGYLCQMEPVAHFGLGKQAAVGSVIIRWPDGSTKTLQAPPIKTVLRVDHPSVKARCDSLVAACPSGYFLRQDAADIECSGAAGTECALPADRGVCCDAETQVVSTVDALWGHYNEIFPNRNRNAASHLWSSFLLKRSHKYTDAKFRELFSGFCGVSGSPVTPSDGKRYRMTLSGVPGAEAAAKKAGMMYFCCSPCVCDTLDFIKVDTKTITLANGVTKQYRFGVLGHACHHPEQLAAEYTSFNQVGSLKTDAPDLQCKGCELSGATLSDNGYVIVNMFHEDEPKLTANDAHSADYTKFCKDRADEGYNSGMGFIFRKMAAVASSTDKATCCADTDCKGSWGTCSKQCTRTFIGTWHSGKGKACSAQPPCKSGDGECSGPVSMTTLSTEEAASSSPTSGGLRIGAPLASVLPAFLALALCVYLVVQGEGNGLAEWGPRL